MLDIVHNITEFRLVYAHTYLSHRLHQTDRMGEQSVTMSTVVKDMRKDKKQSCNLDTHIQTA
jgi:hypothetical protein